ncbi:MAG: hypothetical protein Q7R84_02765 [bacterium]|nr:hypothetical protein [bacterium]
MKLKVLYTIIMIGVLIFGPIGCLSQKPETPKPETQKPDYAIEYLSPDVIRLTAFSADSFEDGTGYTVRGYGNSFAKGIEEVGKKYEITGTSVVIYSRYAHVSSNQLLIIVKPRK